MPQQVVESFVRDIGFNVAALWTGMTTQERSDVASQFNDPSSNLQVLVVTYRTCSLGLNLHKTFSAVVMLESAINGSIQVATTEQRQRKFQETLFKPFSLTLDPFHVTAMAIHRFSTAV